MPNTAAGYIPDTPENVVITGKGLAPKFWWDITAPDGDASPWASAPIGSLYVQKANETARAVLYFKADMNGNDNDWGSVHLGRTFSGQATGLLLALTHR